MNPVTGAELKLLREPIVKQFFRQASKIQSLVRPFGSQTKCIDW